MQLEAYLRVSWAGLLTCWMVYQNLAQMQADVGPLSSFSYCLKVLGRPCSLFVLAVKRRMHMTVLSTEVLLAQGIFFSRAIERSHSLRFFTTCSKPSARHAKRERGKLGGAESGDPQQAVDSTADSLKPSFHVIGWCTFTHDMCK